MDVSPRQSQFEVLEFGVECFTSRNSKDVALLEDVIEVYSAKTSPSEAKVDLQDFFSVDHVVWPACKAPLLTYRSISHIKFPLMAEGKKPAKIYSCFEIIKSSSAKWGKASRSTEHQDHAGHKSK